jgi:hypothetical protein
MVFEKCGMKFHGAKKFFQKCENCCGKIFLMDDINDSSTD